MKKILICIVPVLGVSACNAATGNLGSLSALNAGLSGGGVGYGVPRGYGVDSGTSAATTAVAYYQPQLDFSSSRQ